jgi:oligoribonuclease
MPGNPHTNLFWVDLEMTGLKPETDVILEAAGLVTDQELNILAEGPDLIIHQDDKTLAAMDEKVKAMHTASGLWEKVRQSPTNLADAEKMFLEFVKKYCTEKASPICGNSVYKDKQFIEKYLPDFDTYMNYRLIDVSAVKELVKRWYPQVPRFEKQKKHRALDDIKESVAELAYYRERIFKNGV